MRLNARRMILGILIGLGGLGAVVLAFLNRNELSDKTGARLLAPYLLVALVSIGAGVFVAVLTAHAGNTNSRVSP